MKITENKIYLMPGELVVTTEPEIIWTVLGSCVSVVFHHKNSGLSGMCHAQMPEQKKYKTLCSDSCTKPCHIYADEKNEFKFVSCSVRHLISAFERKGITYEDIDVYLFGGGRVINIEQTGFNIGQENINVAKKMLKSNNLKIKKEDVGGTFSRTLNFHTDTGKYDLISRDMRKSK